ncbi:ribonuclease E/G [Ponticoccus sp. SC2-23]|uniref:Rne/Rng family ribonuclease n=1 Tax=Alexandriicola marinus TaxID=2081710 RepID=UPI000FDC62A4|nr:ribonuclease E/G [Alexandriicola marinus]MBM1219006.1 ribonuclease E/G [Ponticoccus sp. SC6-9]MBM1223922.1 ribonuclease E/G [Ponticoccus sp. SC6-15]MBM1230299.1 ribonuclease E/G [Ponticoccus sp. SC6-38]MBM1232888.1 ribonuclease E/G [Ponticoccus sp. SC6-45]MBM1237162.1 ribonuclease E/G [Ponticoccus sp. SC6-49]MBM1241899.1 ribonuclease E/G [Ponticoccus sp. SC2-64]MBM1246412.1 ribonuclease E/G [Ponticoccus sp. SC6-42]MBM1250890.1 ribonuclease E/G [Ponticoccus sp. SC6-33]MBM1255171.1 ribonu
MAKKMLIDATHAEETRVVVVDGNKVEEFDFESAARRQLAGNIYLAKVTRVEPSLQAAFIDYGGNRHGFLAFSEIHPDYYQIPIADREALLAEEKAYAESLAAESEEEEKSGSKSRSRRRSRSRTKAAETGADAVATADVDGMETIDLDEGDGDDGADPLEGSSPMELVSETPVETPAADEDLAEGDDATAGADGDTTEAETETAEAEAPRRRSRRRSRSKSADDETQSADEAGSDDDDGIESVADDDDSEDVRPVRKPRPRRYKIQEVIKVRQIMLVQVVKEERGNKGAALTTYLSLAGRYCVLMPNTARGGGISRKITNAVDRKKLKEIANSMDVPEGAGLIIRTAGSQRTKSEIKRDYEYLQRLWEQIRELTLRSVAPAKIYEEGDLIKRSIRDLYSKEIDEVIVEGAEGYRTAKDFMKMIMPSHAKNVKAYAESLPLFARYQVESYLSAMFNPTVQLPSGGYIVIGVTEALVAIDVNSGRATKEGSIEQTALKTNLEAAEEVARQLRLRDLAGLIVIDFIDMDERRNNTAVEKRFKDKLKTDRARIQVGRISGFGLLEMSRQRLRPGMLEATTQPCPHCHGTGLLRSDDNVALAILRQLEEEGVRGRTREVLVKVPFGIMNYLMNFKREHIAQIEQRFGLAVRVEGDPTLVSPDYKLEKFKTATRAVPDVSEIVVSADAALIEPEEEDEDDTVEAASEQPTSEEAQGEDRPRKKRRRRRRRRGGANGAETNGDTETTQDGEADADAEAPSVEAAEQPASTEPAPADAESTEEKPKRRRSRSRKPKADEAETPAAEEAAPAEAETSSEATPAAEPVAEVEAPAEAEAEPAPKPKRTRRKKAPEPVAEEAAPAAEAVTEEAPAAEEAPKPKRTRKPRAKKVEEPAVAEAVAEPVAAEATAAPETVEAPAEPQAAEPAPVGAEAVPEPEPAAPAEAAEEKPAKPKKRGWWAMGR